MKEKKRRSLRSFKGCNGARVPRKGHIYGQGFQVEKVIREFKYL